MSWYAIDAVEDALAATREFLLPFRLRRWLALAVMAFFLGGGSGASNGVNTTGTAGSGAEFDVGPVGAIEHSIQPLGALLALVGLVVVLALAYALVGAVMRFVFVDALRTGEARIRGRFGARTADGLRLFGFQLVVVLPVLVPVGLALATLLIGGSPLFFVLALPFVLLFGLVGGLVLFVTTEFVVPVMIAEDAGVLAGWKRFVPTLRREWKQFGVYLLVRFVLGVAASILVGLLTGVVAIPLAAVGALAFFTHVSELTAVLLLVLAAPVVLLSLALALLVQVPIQSYLGYFALFVLGDANPEFDLIPDRRAAAREQ